MTENDQIIVEFRRVNFQIGAVKILDDLNLQTNKGEILRFIFFDFYNQFFSAFDKFFRA